MIDVNIIHLKYMVKWLDGITKFTDMSLSKFRELVINRKAWLACSPWGHRESYTTE